MQLKVEQPSAQQRNVKLDTVAVETFDREDSGLHYVYDTDFGNSSYRGTYDYLRLVDHDIFGGAEGEGLYPVATEENYYRLRIREAGPDGFNYFGLWISTFDDDNRMEFYYREEMIYTLNTKEVDEKMEGSLSYLGNPNYWLWIPIHRYVFVNIFFGPLIYDEIRFFAQANRFESDNHSVGRYTVTPGEVIPGEPTVGSEPPAVTLSTEAPGEIAPTPPDETLTSEAPGAGAPTFTAPPGAGAPTPPDGILPPDEILPTAGPKPVSTVFPKGPQQIPTRTRRARTKKDIIIPVALIAALIVAIILFCAVWCRQLKATRRAGAAGAAPAAAAAAESPKEVSFEEVTDEKKPQRDLSEREKRSSVVDSWFP